MKFKHNIRIIILIFFCSAFISFIPYNISNRSEDLPNWSLLDPAKDGYEGARTKTFYEYLETLAQKPDRNEVIVAVIDSGFDIEHPDLKDNAWRNEAEINGIAGVDDDGNGYIDDFYGWNFLGNARYLSLEVTRELERLKKTNVPKSDPYYQKVEEAYKKERNEVENILEGVSYSLEDVIEAEAILKTRNYTTDPRKLMEIASSLPERYSDAAGVILGVYMLFGLTKDDLIAVKKEYEIKQKNLFSKTAPYTLIGDDPTVLLEKNYGNNDVTTKEEIHGTHVAGIIAAKNIGHAPFAKIMYLKAVPEEGDERDKDIGNAIRYAVDNGASIINMSAGKYFSPSPEFVVDAINYAAEKGVLFVVSAGNEGEDIENLVNYPRKFTTENGRIKYFDNVIVIGSNTWMQKWSKEKDPDNLTNQFDLASGFSNYGKNVVDLFAPGQNINSTIPNNQYKIVSGTSMASPQVSGVAAVIKAYFPEFTASDIKEVLTSSARKYPQLMVKAPGKESRTRFSDLSISGGVLDLMNAWNAAMELKERKYTNMN
jgi:subtilisin family serine protease